MKGNISPAHLIRLSQKGGLLLYLVLHLGVYFLLSHGVPGFDRRGLRLGTDSIFLANIVEYEANKNAYPSDWLEYVWPWNYWETVQKISSAYAMTIPGKWLHIVLGPGWRLGMTMLNAAVIWCAWSLLSPILFTGKKGRWYQAAKLWFLLNPLTVYLNTQISKEGPVLLALVLILQACNLPQGGTKRFWSGIGLFSMGLGLLLWLRGWEQTGAFAFILVPCLLIRVCQSFKKKAAWQPKVHFMGCLLLLVGLLLLAATQRVNIRHFAIYYGELPAAEARLKTGVGLEMGQEKWTRKKISEGKRANPVKRFETGSEIFFNSSEMVGENPFGPAIFFNPPETVAGNRWICATWLPKVLDVQIANLTARRAGFLSTPGVANFTRPIPHHFLGALLCSPRAFADGALLPVQDFLTSKNVGNRILGWLLLPVFLATLLLMLFFLANLAAQKCAPSSMTVLCLVVSSWGLFLYGYVVLNLGTLVRLRHPFWVLMVTALMAAAQWFRDRQGQHPVAGLAGKDPVEVQNNLAGNLS